MTTNQTLIKWPGGKSKEYDQIKNLIPRYSRYVEPFFGGGAIFFNVQPQNAIINDICSELMDFYRFVKGERDKKEFSIVMYDYVDNWEKIPKYINVFQNNLIDLYNKYKTDSLSNIDLKSKIILLLKSKEDQFNGLFTKEFALTPDNLLDQIIKNIISKLNRTKIIEKEKGNLAAGDLSKNIETAFRSGFYMHFRDIMNKASSNSDISLAKIIANYYFIREFCYGSMFRFNSEGHFNIPYGGIAYNQKGFRNKVDYVFSQQIEDLFKGTHIHNEDFEKILTRKDINSDDFIFLDPPYDTDFSNYEKANFDKNDQERLAKVLYNIKAKYLMIIKNTQFIHNLYNNRKGIKIESFEKKYQYNVKGRNDRDVEHLIIYNY